MYENRFYSKKLGVHGSNDNLYDKLNINMLIKEFSIHRLY